MAERIDHTLEMVKARKLRKVSAMTYDLIFDAYYFACLKASHDKFKYFKIAERMTKRISLTNKE